MADLRGRLDRRSASPARPGTAMLLVQPGSSAPYLAAQPTSREAMMKTIHLLPAALLLSLAPPILGADGDWPMWRHDPALTGYQPAPGAMAREPRILTRHLLGASPGTATFADLLGSGRDAEVIVLAGPRLAAYGTDAERLWESRPQGYVLDHVE